MAVASATASAGALLLAGALLAGCADSQGAGSAPRTLSIVALGDSVPRGTGCGCRPYPELTADELTSPPQLTVAATNDAVAGATTQDVLRQVTSDPGVIDRVKAADAVEIEVGANDVEYTSACGTSVDCYAPKVAPLRENLDAIVARVRVLTAGHQVPVVLLDYWSVWLGGQFAADQGEAYVAAAQTLTQEVNTAIKSVATGSGSGYVDLRAAFKGPDYSYDETHYLAPDGDHPNEAGHERIAAASVDVMRPALQL